MKDYSSSDAGVAFRLQGRPNVVLSSNVLESSSTSPVARATAWTSSSRSSKTWADLKISLRPGKCHRASVSTRPKPVDASGSYVREAEPSR
jgi:hypothetical protein